MRRHVQAVGVAVALLTVSAPEAFSCSCSSTTLAWRFNNAAGVFTAVTGDGYDDSSAQFPSVRTPIAVTRSFKGAVPFDTVVSETGGASCGISLDSNVEYLFFTSDEGHVGLCSGIRKSAEAGPEIAAIQAFLSGETPAIREPWLFTEDEFACNLATGFLKEEAPYIRGYVQLRAAKRGVELPDFARGPFTVDVRLQSSFTGKPDDISPGALQVTVNDVTHDAAWLGFDIEYEYPDGTSGIFKLPPSFLIVDESAEALAGELRTAGALRVQLDGTAVDTSFDVSLSTVAMEDSFAQFWECTDL